MESGEHLAGHSARRAVAEAFCVAVADVDAGGIASLSVVPGDSSRQAA